MVDKPLDLVSTVISPLLFLLLAAGSVAAAELEPAPAADLESAAAAEKEAPASDKGSTPAAEQAAEGEPAAAADLTAPATDLTTAPTAEEPEPETQAAERAPLPEDERQVEVLEQKGGSLGYNWVTGEGYRGRALEYGFLKSSRSGGLFYRHMEKDTNVELEGFYLNENDYHGDLLMDYRGDYRLHLRTESLFHNLDRELLFTDKFFLFSSTPSPDPDNPLLAEYRPEQKDSSATRYGVSVVQDRADFRYRLHNFPLHVNLGYWRYVKEGTIQQRFADTSFEGTVNRIYAQPRAVDQQTQEGRIGFDAHLGPVDFVYDFKVRYFEDRLPTPVDNFEARSDIHGNPEYLGGLRQHNENPDSSFFSHTVKLYTSLAGGLVGSGSYSVEQRENLSDLSDTTGARHTRVYLQNGALDLVYTPYREYTLALKYRRQEVDHGNRGTLLNSNYVDPVQVAKFPIETTRDLVTGTIQYRPRHDLSFLGEYRGDFQRRNNVSLLPSPTTWAEPANTATHTGLLAAYYRPIKGLRTSARYSYATSDHPAYGASYQNRHEAKLLVTYSLSNRWGLTSHAVFRRDQNDEVKRFLVNFPFEPLSYTAAPLASRRGNSENANVGIWWVPVQKLTVGANYSYLHYEVEEAVLFTGVFTGSEAASQFSSKSHVYSVNASYALGEKWDLALTAQQIRSSAAFSPTDTTFISGSTAGVKQLTEQDTVISSLSARGEYRFSSVLSTTLEYTLKDYDEKKPAYQSYNGTVHAIVASLAAKW